MITFAFSMDPTTGGWISRARHWLFTFVHTRQTPADLPRSRCYNVDIGVTKLPITGALGIPSAPRTKPACWLPTCAAKDSICASTAADCQYMAHGTALRFFASVQRLRIVSISRHGAGRKRAVRGVDLGSCGLAFPARTLPPLPHGLALSSRRHSVAHCAMPPRSPLYAPLRRRATRTALRAYLRAAGAARKNMQRDGLARSRPGSGGRTISPYSWRDALTNISFLRGRAAGIPSASMPHMHASAAAGTADP